MIGTDNNRMLTLLGSFLDLKNAMNPKPSSRSILQSQQCRARTFLIGLYYSLVFAVRASYAFPVQKIVPGYANELGSRILQVTLSSVKKKFQFSKRYSNQIYDRYNKNHVE